MNKTSRSMFGVLVGVALVTAGALAIALNAHVVRSVWGADAVVATSSPPQEDVGQIEFVLAYSLGNGGFGIGTCLILVGLAVTGFFLGAGAAEIQTKKRQRFLGAVDPTQEPSDE